MSVITVFNALYCNEDLIIQQLIEKTGYRLVNDNEVVTLASKLSGIAPERITRAFTAKTSLFNPFTHEKERSIAYLRLAVAEILPQGKLVISGFSSHLVPAIISHVLRICLIAEMNSRISQAKSAPFLEKDPPKAIHKSDEDRAAWTTQLLQNNDPWNPALYDICLLYTSPSPRDGLLSRMPSSA